MNLEPNKQLLLSVPFQLTKFRKKELRVDNKLEETIGDVFCPTRRNEKCVYVSNNKTTSFYDCEKCKACCHVLNIALMDQKATICCLAVMVHIVLQENESRLRDRKPSPILKKFLRQSQPSTSEPEPKKAEFIPSMV